MTDYLDVIPNVSFDWIIIECIKWIDFDQFCVTWLRNDETELNETTT